MTTRRVAVLSGISTRVADKIAPSLRSMGTEVVFVKIDPEGINESYFDRLIARSLDVLGRLRGSEDTKLLGLLVSCVPTTWEASERVRFFPSFQRSSIEAAFRNDINRSSEVVIHIMKTFSSSQFDIVVKSTTPQQDARLLLPVRNSGVDRLSRHFNDVYDMRAFTFSRRLERDVMKMKKGKGYRVRDLKFKGAVNDGTHPVRKRTASAICDLHALMRFGTSVAERFEFDVTADNGLLQKTFYLCDGAAAKITQQTSHLNMRINDDFAAG